MAFNENSDMDAIRRSITYHPSVWGDYFLAYDSVEIPTAEKDEHERLTEEVRKLMNETPNDHSIIDKLELIDAIRRLGVAYHFENEIDESLEKIYDNYLMKINNNEIEDNLHLVALRFRLLRQQGYNTLPEDAFDKFINDHEEKSKLSLANNNNNIRGILSLYEASHVGIHGEKILDDALLFSSACLIERKANNVLKFPIHKTLPIYGGRKFISMYQDDESHNGILLKFAKLDFNLEQKKHRQELSELTRWKKVLDYEKKYSFARDRMVECYFWGSSGSFEPQFSYERTMLGKVLIVITLIDDIYDIYGTMEDLELFTNAVQRWDLNAMEQLPSYMKECYRTLLDVYREMEDYETVEMGKPYRTQFAKQVMIKMVGAYMEEAKWLYNKYIPTMEEYMKVGYITAGQMMMLSVSLVCLGKLVTHEEFEFIATSDQPLILQAANVIARLMDDLAGYGFETRITAIDCYMNQNGSSKEVTYHELEKEVSKAWKDINQECLQQTFLSKHIRKRVLNFSRLIHLYYTDNFDTFTNSKNKMKELIRIVLVEPVPI